jgi:hypothetical protein
MQFTHPTGLRSTMAAGLLRVSTAIPTRGSAVTLQLATDGARAAIEHACHAADAEALLLQAGQGDAVFGLELGVGWRTRQHDGTLQGRVLHFRFESAEDHYSEHKFAICSER